jgi:hypothetical protein
MASILQPVRAIDYSSSHVTNLSAASFQQLKEQFLQLYAKEDAFA